MTLAVSGPASGLLGIAAKVLASSMLALLSLAAADLGAEDSDSFQWSATRKLTWDDFAGAAVREDGVERVAATTASILWSYDFHVRLAGGACTYTITAIDSAAHFHPVESWVDPEHRNAAVLGHEQGHFDIAEIYSRQFEASTRQLIGSEYECHGQSMGRATREAEEAIAAQLGEIYDATWARYRARQQAYDGDTGHGTGSGAQSQWAECIEATLGGGPSCWPATAFPAD